MDDVGPGAWLAIARIVRPRGRRGEVLAEVLSDFGERFKGLQQAFIEDPVGSPRQLTISELWWHGNRLVLRFEGTGSISEAELLRGRLLLVPREQCAKLGANQYYVADLIGCQAVHKGQRIGEVTDVEPTGGADLLHVQPGEGVPGGELLIPFAQEICPEVDIAARRIRIEPPEGLLELNQEGPESGT